jgi:hypothetical protein
VDTNKCNESQYNENTNTLLVVLLLLVLLKCDKTKKKCEAISHALQEEHIFNEDIPKTTKDSEINANYFKNKRIKSNIEKAKIKMLIKDLKSNTEPSIYLEEVDEQNIEHLEEIDEQNIEHLEEVKEQTNEFLEEVDKQGIEPLAEDKPIEIKNESLEESHKKNLEEIKSSVDYFSGNAIRSMEIILKQLVGEYITFSTVSKSNGFAVNAILLSVKDGIVHIDTSHSILSIPICDIVGIESNLIHSIELQPLVEISTEEFYEYKDWSLGNLFSTMIGEQIFIETTGSGSFNNINDKIITNIGQGIVVLDNTMAISLNRIILVERR